MVIGARACPDIDPMPPADAPADILIHVGAREDGPIPLAPGRPGLRRILVQPDPDLANALARSAGPDAEVLALGLAPETGRATLLQMNFSALNSFHEPTEALRSLFPGLKVLRRLPVSVLDPAALLDRIGAAGQAIDLVLDAPGSELAILQAWKAADALGQVRRLVLRVGGEVFFEGAADRTGVAAFLAAECFAPDGVDSGDPDWPVTTWRADPALRALKATLAETEARARAAEARVKATEAALAETKTQLDTITAKADWRHNRIGELEAQLKATEAALAEARGTAEARAKALADTEARARAAEERVKATEAALAEARGTAEVRAKALADTETRARAAEAKRDEVLATQDFQTRFQAMLQVDLADLRRRLETSETQRQRQEDLLRKLTAKLTQAAEHIRQLPVPAEPAQIGQALSEPAAAGKKGGKHKGSGKARKRAKERA
jgi:hypothetical protein